MGDTALRARRIPTGAPGQTLAVEGAPLTMLLVETLAVAGRHGGTVVIEQIDGAWHASITNEKRRVVSAHDPYLEGALERLNARAAARDG